MPRAARKRMWSFTWNNYSKDQESSLRTLHERWSALKFICFQKERASQTGTPHLQGFVWLGSARTFTAVKQALAGSAQGVHIEACNGTFSQNLKYCTKEETRELGSIPYEWGQRKVDKDSIVDLIKGNASMKEIFEAHPNTFLRSHHGIVVAKDLYNRQRKITDDFNIFVFYGKTGSGKTHKAYDISPDLFRVDLYNKGFPFNGYNGEETILLDDYRNQLPYYKLLEVCDIYKKNCNIKHGRKKWNVKNVILTSVKHPNLWHGKIPDKSELWRRLKQFGQLFFFHKRVINLQEWDLIDPIINLNFSKTDLSTNCDPSERIDNKEFNYDYDFT